MDIELYWVDKVALAIGPCPPGGENLFGACRAIRAARVDVLVSLQPEVEAEGLGLADEAKAVFDAGMMFYRFAILDHQTPPFTAETFQFIETLAQHLDERRRLFIHCYAGIGRSAMMAACVLIEHGYTPQAAVRALSIARGYPVPETEAQFEWIRKFASRHKMG